MGREYVTKISKRLFPKEFSKEVKNTIRRIVLNNNVVGIIHFQNHQIKMSTVPENYACKLIPRLPDFTRVVQRAVSELDVLDELIAFRIETKTTEIMVAPGKTFIACVVQKNQKKGKKYPKKGDSQLTALINDINPVVDRIMDDDSVEGVVMTNKDGAPIFTNLNLVGATPYAMQLKRFGAMTQAYIKELDIFDEVLIIRLNTRKIEIMVAPHKEFNVIVIQHARIKSQSKK